MQHEFRYKLDFYYQQSLIYLLTFTLYAGVKGTFVEDNFTVVFGDPILTIIGFFVLTAFATLILNLVRDRKVVVTDKEIIFQHRFNRRAVAVQDIEWIHVGKERLVRTAGRFQMVMIKAKHRRRVFRIRLGRYERERELLKHLEQFAEHAPKRKEQFSFTK